jgi:hypothetical protein
MHRCHFDIAQSRAALGAREVISDQLIVDLDMRDPRAMGGSQKNCRIRAYYAQAQYYAQ